MPRCTKSKADTGEASSFGQVAARGGARSAALSSGAVAPTRGCGRLAAATATGGAVRRAQRPALAARRNTAQHAGGVWALVWRRGTRARPGRTSRLSPVRERAAATVGSRSTRSSLSTSWPMRAREYTSRAGRLAPGPPRPRCPRARRKHRSTQSPTKILAPSTRAEGVRRQVRHGLPRVADQHVARDLLGIRPVHARRFHHSICRNTNHQV